jgi:hypothetical protein
MINITMEQNNTMHTFTNQEQKPQESRPNEHGLVAIRGHIKIFDPETKEVFQDKPNAIHYENFSIALANSIANQGLGTIEGMAFGNGGTRVDDTGIITYLTPNTIGRDAELYNKTYYKTVDAQRSYDSDPSRNYMEIRHMAGAPYTDILISCLLDFGEPAGQDAFDNSVDTNGNYIFDELGLRAYSPDGPGMGPLLTHVIFHPVQKSLNRMIQIDYTVRIQSLSGAM